MTIGSQETETFVRRGYRTRPEAEAAAAPLGNNYLVCDEGEWVSPRYWIIRMFEVGEEVSYGFNGDYYPCGKITAITESKRKITATDDSGKVCVFWRRRESGAWKYNRTWTLMRGVHNERNPSF